MNHVVHVEDVVHSDWMVESWMNPAHWIHVGSWGLTLRSQPR
jgi:hypothetical protein